MLIKMEKYINEIPLVVRNSLKALSDEKRQGILIYLLRTGSKSFIEISKDLKIPKNNLSHHIKILMRYALIYNFYDRNEYNDKYSFYKISKLGKKMIENLLTLVSPIIYEEEEESSYDLIEYIINAEESFYTISVFGPVKISDPSPRPGVLTGFTAGIGILGGKIGYEWASRKRENFLMNTAE